MSDHKLLVPAYKLTFGHNSGPGAAAAAQSVISSGKVVDTTDEPKASTLVELKVMRDLAVPADSFVLTMGQVGGFRPARGDTVKVELGYADDDRGLFHVLTGDIVVLEPGLAVRRLVGHGAAEKLLRTRTVEHFVGVAAGNMVKELASRAKVDVERADDGIRFPAYVIDSGRSVYHQMREIADLSGCDLYLTPEGKLVFEKFVSGKTVHVFEFARDILSLDLVREEPAATQVKAFGQSPGAGKGENSWAWLTKDFASFAGTAGNGTALRLLERPALRSAAAAKIAAQAQLTRLERRATRGRMLLTGQPQVKLGDAVRVGKVPHDDMDGAYQVTAVTHRITKSAGFTTSIDFRSSAS